MRDFESSSETGFQNGHYNSKLSQKFAYFYLFHYIRNFGRVEAQLRLMGSSAREETKAADLGSAAGMLNYLIIFS